MSETNNGIEMLLELSFFGLKFYQFQLFLFCMFYIYTTTSRQSNEATIMRSDERISKGQSKMDNPEKLAAQGTQYEENHNTMFVGHHCAQTNRDKQCE